MGIENLLLRSPTGFERIVLKYRHRVYGFACHMLGDSDEAADLTQDVFLKLWTSRRSIDGSRVLPWLLFVTRNACIDALRHRRTVHRVFGGDERDLEGESEASERPDVQIERRELRQTLEGAVQALPEPYRSIVILREIQDMKYAEICGALDLPLTSVKVYLHRARRKLREMLAESVVADHELREMDQ